MLLAPALTPLPLSLPRHPSSPLQQEGADFSFPQESGYTYGSSSWGYEQPAAEQQWSGSSQ